MTTPSFSRLGSANTYDTARSNLMSRQTALSNAQEHLTSGKRVSTASDDPTAAAQAERALTRISRIQTDQRALEAQKSAIAQAESTLGDVNDALQNFRELVVSAGNGAYSASERKSIAGQLSGLRDQVFALANRKDTNGQPLFGALASALTPFVGPQSVAPDYTFNGLPGQTASSEIAIPFALDGDSAFMLQAKRDGVFNTTAVSAANTLKTDQVVLTNAALVTGSSYTISGISIGPGSAAGMNKASYTLTETVAGSSTPLLPGVSSSGPDYASASTTIPIALPGLSFNLIGTPTLGDSVTLTPSASIFSVMDNAIRDIGSATTNTQATQAVSQALGNIDIGMGRISAVRGQAGDLLNRADRISSNQDKRSIQLESDRSRAEDLDMVKGISDFQNQQTGYQAALQSYAQVQKLSLFNYIG
jgi:flagellar hook-associated protein 3 FlgL